VRVVHICRVTGMKAEFCRITRNSFIYLGNNVLNSEFPYVNEWAILAVFILIPFNTKNVEINLFHFGQFLTQLSLQ
jgi:hypothetical protein